MAGVRDSFDEFCSNQRARIAQGVRYRGRQRTKIRRQEKKQLLANGFAENECVGKNGKGWRFRVDEIELTTIGQTGSDVHAPRLDQLDRERQD